MNFADYAVTFPGMLTTRITANTTPIESPKRERRWRLFDNDIALLEACLRLRDEYEELSDTTPPDAASIATMEVFVLMANSLRRFRLPLRPPCTGINVCYRAD